MEYKVVFRFTKIILLLTFCCNHYASAQDISVSSFKLLGNDLTANTMGTMERDQNGEVAALIKVVTTEQGFVFDGGMSGIVKTKQEVGEVWVYVPHGIKKITIKHPQLGVLRDYWFPVPVEKARTYEMRLVTGTIQTFVNQSINKQFVVFEVTPSNATVELNNESLSLDEEGHAEKNVPFGKYVYRVSALNYHTEAGVIEVNNSTSKYILKLNLRPNFGWLEIPDVNNLNGADVYMNNVKKGKAPFKSEALKSGTYKLKIVKPLYKSYEKDIEIEDGKIKKVDVTLEPNFAQITFIATEGTEIYVDGERKGINTWTGPLEKGSYTVETRKNGCRNVSIVVHITTEEARSIQLPNPIPILSAIEVTSTPSNATVMMDGKEVGTTPIMLSDILVGEHELTFSKKNYQTITKRIEVKENETAKLHVGLSGECKIKINATPSGSKVEINGKHHGITPLESSLYAGNYTILISKEGYSPIKKIVTIDGSKESFDFVLKRRYVYPNSIYADAGFSFLRMPNIYGAIGLFSNNINAELGYACGLQQSGAIYWNGNDGFYERYYTPRVVTGKMGYGIMCSNRVRITPQVGCRIVNLHERQVADSEEVILEGASMMSGVLSTRCDIMLGEHFGFSFVPQYLLSLWSSSWATKLKDLSSTINRWANGFSLQTGVSLYF